jgi:hypothetical protein
MCGSMCTACESLVDIGVFSKNREAKDCFPSAPTESCDTNQFRVVEDQLCKVFGMRLDMVSNFDYMLAELFICLCGTARSSWKVPKLRFQCDQAGHHGDSQIVPAIVCEEGFHIAKEMFIGFLLRIAIDVGINVFWVGLHCTD